MLPPGYGVKVVRCAAHPHGYHVKELLHVQYYTSNVVYSDSQLWSVVLCTILYRL